MAVLQSELPSKSSRQEIVSRNPANGAAIGGFVPLDPGEVVHVLDMARQAGQAWRQKSLGQRLEILQSAYREVFVAQDKFASLISEETGKPLAEAFSSELMPILDCFKYYLRNSKKLLREERLTAVNLILRLRRGYLRYEPFGVIAVISPWNYPFLLAMQHIVPGLIAGNAILHKPSELTTLTGLEIGELFRRSGLPAHVLNVLPGLADVGRALVASPVDKIFFTGSTEVGRKIYQTAAQRLVPVNLELGGSDAMIVFEDADQERAANAAIWAGLTNAGQACVSVERLLVQDVIAKQFLDKMVEKIARLRFRGTDSFGEIGSLNNEQQFAKVEKLVKDAIANGAKVICGGNSGPGKNVFAPTILTDIQPEMKLNREEIFGPILCVKTFSNESQAVALANNTDYGLSASVWTRDAKKGKRIAEQMECGSVLVNEVLVHIAQFEAPYSGFKSSGLGTSHGRWGLYEMVRPKYISEDRKFVRRILEKFFPSFAANDIWWFRYDQNMAAEMKAILSFLHAPQVLTKIRSLGKTIKALFRSNYL